MSESRNWLIIGHYGGSNTGDEAMLYGLLSAVPACRRPQIIVATRDWEKELPLNQQGITLIAPQVKPILAHLKMAEGLILGGGTHFHDDYVGLRYWRHYRYMARFVILNLIAKLLGKKVLWLGMGWGPIARKPTRWLTNVGAALCDAITVRESASLAETGELHKQGKVRLSFDLAALLKIEQQPLAERANLLGVSIMSMKDLKHAGEILTELYLKRLAQALQQRLSADPSLHIRIFMIRGGERESDVKVSEQLYELLALQDVNRVQLIPYHPDPLVIIKQMSECRAFIATRFHAGLLSYLCGCRLLFLAYHRKVADLADEIGLHGDAVLPVSTELPPEILYERVEQLVTATEWYKPSLGTDEAVRRANESIAIWRDIGEILT